MQVHIISLDSVDSTNIYAKEHLKGFPKDQLLCVTAKVQTHGRGTYAKSWVSVEGNLHMSLAFFLPSGDNRLPRMAKLASKSCAQALENAGIQVEMKLPNDLLVDGKKLCGILVETTPLGELKGVIVGIGMNVNAPVTTDQATTSLYEVTGEKWDLHDLRDKIALRWIEDFGLAERN